MRGIFAFITLLCLIGCSDVGQAVDERARAGTKGIVIEALATRFPEVSKEQLEPFADCILVNARAVELRRFAKAAVVGVSDETVSTIRAVLTRSQTVQCLQQNALAAGAT